MVVHHRHVVHVVHNFSPIKQILMHRINVPRPTNFDGDPMTYGPKIAKVTSSTSIAP